MMPSATKNLFEKRVLDSQKLLFKQKFCGGPGGSFLKEPPAVGDITYRLPAPRG